jgi:tetratricopeptide (TPR) repeat protein
MRITNSLLAASLVGLAVLCFLPNCAPYTRWKLFSIARFGGSQQTYYDYTTGTGAPNADLKPRVEQIRRAYRDDFVVQWALANAAGATEQQRTRELLLELKQRFPNRPEVYASLLRNEMRQFPLGREEESRFGGDGAPARPAIPAAVARVLEWAQQGERLDPNNAFFVGMQVRTLLAQRRDAEAIRALQRAAQLPRWDDYLSTEAEASVRLQRLLMNRRSGEVDLALSTAILFPHLARERAMGRVLTVRAWELERQGKYREALEIRRALARYGQRLTEGNSILRTLIGVALIQIAAAPLRTGEPLAPERRQKQFLEQLQRNGYSKEAAWFRAEMERCEIIRARLQQATPALFDGQIMPALRQYYGQMLALFALLGLGLFLGSQWLMLWLTQRLRLGWVVGVSSMMGAWLIASLLFTLSDAGALMARMVASIHVAEQLIVGRETTSLPALSPEVMRWALPVGVSVVGLIVSGVAVLMSVLRRRESPVEALQALVQTMGSGFAVALLGLCLTLLLNWRTDTRLEAWAQALRHDEVGAALRAAGLEPTLPTPTP